MPQNYANRIKQTLALTPPVSCPREPRPEGEPCTTYYDFELFCLFVRFSTGCRARSPGKSGRGPAPGSSVHHPAVPSDARRRGAAGSARKAARTGSISRGRFFHHPRIYGERALFFCGEIMTQRPATAGPAAAAAAAAAAAVHRACYNQLSTTLQRYRAQQQQQATPCACDRSALYCVELLWKAPEIHHPSHLLVPGTISRLLCSLFCFVRHNTQVHVTAHNYSASSSKQRHARVEHTRCTLSSCCRT